MRKKKKPEMKPYEQTEDCKKFQREFTRQGGIVEKSAEILEQRTYELSAGGLGIAIAAFSFIGKAGLTHKWVICVILGIFTLCLVLHFISQRVALRKGFARQRLLNSKMDLEMKYSGEELEMLYNEMDKSVAVLNDITHYLLISGILITGVYLGLHFLEL